MGSLSIEAINEGEHIRDSPLYKRPLHSLTLYLSCVVAMCFSVWCSPKSFLAQGVGLEWTGDRIPHTSVSTICSLIH